jgi:hypothetical protein
VLIALGTPPFFDSAKHVHTCSESYRLDSLPTDRCDEAEQILKYQLRELEQAGAHSKSMGVLFTLGRLFFSQGNFTEALPYYQKVRIFICS